MNVDGDMPSGQVSDHDSNEEIVDATRNVKVVNGKKVSCKRSWQPEQDDSVVKMAQSQQENIDLDEQSDYITDSDMEKEEKEFKAAYKAKQEEELADIVRSEQQKQ